MAVSVKTRLLQRTATLALGAGVVLGASVAQAQIEEVVVTAQFRKESVQDIPIAITAFDNAFVENSFVEDVESFDKYVPNVVMSDINFSGQTLGASIRGVSFADLEKTFEPAVGVLVDGVFLGTNTGANFDVFDVESIEILRGPQGTLYGRNTIGGTINVRRTRPTGEWGARVSARLGSLDKREFLFVGNTEAFADVLAIKVFASSKEDNSFTENAFTGERDPWRDIMSGGFAAEYKPTENFTALLSVDIFNDDSNAPPPVNLTESAGASPSTPGVPYHIFGVDAGATFCDLTQTFAAGGLIPAAQALNGCSAASFALASAEGFDKSYTQFPFDNFIQGGSATLEMVWDTGDYELTSVTGYRESKEELREENLGMPNITFLGTSVPLFVANRLQSYEQLSQEFRVASQYDGDFNFIAGLYYFQSDYSIEPGQAIGSVASQAYVLGAASQIFTAGQDLTSYAGFFDFTYDFAENWRLNAGVRYTVDEKDFAINSITQTGLTTIDPSGVFLFNGSEEWGEPSGRVNLTYSFSDDASAYLGWSRGFRSGGWNGRTTRESAAGPYDPEIVDNYELGFRTEWLDNTVRINPTAFFTTYSEKQEEIIRTGVGGSSTETVVENAGKAEIYGLELEALWQPDDHWTFRGTAGYLNAEYKEFVVEDITNPGTLIDVADSRNIRRAPEFTFNATAQYTTPVSPVSNLTFKVDHSWSDDYTTSPISDPAGRDLVKDDGETDLTVIYDYITEDDIEFQVAGYVKDVFEGRAGKIGTTLNAGVFYFGVLQQGRTWGVDLTAKF